MPKKKLQVDGSTSSSIKRLAGPLAEGSMPILKLNDDSWAILGGSEVKLLKPKAEAPAKAKVDAESWEGVDRGLFDHLRTWRQTVARERKVPPYVVFPDSTLRNLALTRPTNEASLRQISGIGEKRLADFVPCFWI